MDEQLIESKLSREEVAQCSFLKWERWQVELPNGQTAQREIIRHPGASAVVAIDENGCICLVRQYRAALGRVTLELPAGKLDEGEDPADCARRELSEETGFEAGEWSYLTPLASTPGFCDEVIHIYLATELAVGSAHTDEDEFVHTEMMPYAQAVDAVMAGEITDSKSIAGIMMAGYKLGML